MQHWADVLLKERPPRWQRQSTHRNEAASPGRSPHTLATLCVFPYNPMCSLGTQTLAGILLKKDRQGWRHQSTHRHVDGR